jgi:hypothetical protein
MSLWPDAIEKSLRSALAAERQAIGIYEAQVKWLQRWNRRDRALYEEILAEEKHHRSELEHSLAEPGNSRWEHISGLIFGFLLCLLPRSLNYRLHIWAEREAAKAYFLAWKEVKKLPLTGFRELRLRKTLWEQTKQELSHRQRFQTARKGM